MKVIKQFYFLIGILFLMSCEKDYEVEKITFTDIQPDKSLTTYGINTSDFYENNIIVASSKVWINDSLFTYATSRTLLDLNKDGIDDFAFEIRHQLADTSEYIYNDKFIIKLNSLKSNLISMANKNLKYIKSYNINQNIDTSSFCLGAISSENDSEGFLINKEGEENFQLLGEYYVAVKLFVENKQYFGWLHIKVDFFKLTLCDYAVSNEPNTLMKIGQIK